MDAAAAAATAARSEAAAAAARFASSRRFGAGDAAASSSALASVPLELKILGVLTMLLLFLLFLIALLWDRYGREISELYTPSAARASSVGGVNGSGSGIGDAGADAAHVNAVADEYTVYQKLPTFFYEYTPRKKQQ